MKYFIFIGFVLLAFSGFGQQNLIKNGSFEEKEFWVFNDKPNNFEQVGKVKNWVENRTPDWFRANTNFLFINDETGTMINAQEGEHMVGMWRGELIEQELTKLDPNLSYKLVFYVQLTGTGYSPTPVTTIDNFPNAFINIYLSSSKIKYSYTHSSTTRLHCTSTGATEANLNNYMAKDNNVTPFVSIPIDIQTYPLKQWHKVETYLPRNTLNSNLKWIGLDLSHSLMTNEGFCPAPYILIDNVQLYEENCEVCENCSFKDGCINVQIASNPQSTHCVEFTNLHNVTQLKIEIFHGGGGLVRTYALTNPPSEFAWDGKNNFGGNVGAGTFYVKITAFNDCHTTFNVFSIVVPDGNWTCTGITNPVNGDRPPDGQCCGEDLYLNNIILDEDFVYRANRIFVGPNVIISSGVTIEFHAQSLIEISPDLVVEQGADWAAYIDENCIEDDFTNGNDAGSGKITIPTNLTNHDEVDVNDKSNGIHDITTNDVINIYPNPSDGIINITLGDVESSFIQIFDINGKLIKTRISKEYITEIDLSNYSKGIYFIRINQKNSIITQKVIIQ